MKYHIFPTSLVASLLMQFNTFATETNNAIETITITAPHFSLHEQLSAEQSSNDVDIANWLNSIPGANINRNGPLTGIAQFRGLFGDRVATSLNSQPIIGAGPNAMDSPLSYSGNYMVESMTVYQGIAPVSAAINTLGGAINVKTRSADVQGINTLTYTGQLFVNTDSNANTKNMAFFTNISKNNHALLIHTSNVKGDDYQSPRQTISPSEFHKTQSGVNYRYQLDDVSADLSYQYIATNDTGTAALPMDITYIYANQFQAAVSWQMAHWQLHSKLGYMNNKHAMDNFSMRTAISSQMQRRNDANAQTWNFAFSAEKNAFKFGIDGYFAAHNSLISNPDNLMFSIDNFSKVIDNQIGVYSEWQTAINKWQINSGIRLKQAIANSGNVLHSMSSSNTMLATLENKFNQQPHHVKESNIDAVINAKSHIANNTELSLAIAIKQRAPSYQERYLWLPMEATGGLADGNTYVGNINLASETAYQADSGVKFNNQTLLLSSHVFYQKINNYIQGTPTNDNAINMVASMMSNRAPLQYSNVDAILYGIDGRVNYALNHQWQLNAMLSYVRGKRDDINDNLYRIAPLNGNVSINYLANNWQASLQLISVAAQNNVSTTNLEQATSGYSVFNADINWDINSNSHLVLGINNITDKQYSNHLSGYNRVSNNGVDVFSRLPEIGRNIYINYVYSF
jgi:iron complex outermembrane receptor protein